MERKFVINFEHDANSVLFKNNVRISKTQFNALTTIRGFYTDSTPNFIWTELLRLPQTKTELTVKFSPVNLKRFQRELNYLSESGFFKMESREVIDKDRKKIEIKFTKISPAFLSIVHLM